MTSSIVTASLNPSAFPTTFNVTTSHTKNETSADAINIGNLQEQSSVISISDAGSAAGSAVSSTFTAQQGDVSTLSESFGNGVDEATTRFQLYDSAGDVVADSQGTDAQQAAFTEWQAGGLSLDADTYTAIATPELSDTALSIGTTQDQGTSLQVNSQLTGSDATEYYNFSLSSGNNLKLAFDAGSSTPSTRVIVYNSTGGVVADSQGNSFEQANYQAITSGVGLTTSSGDYSVEVTYAKTADPTQPINYNFQLYSGSNYAVVYSNKVTAQTYDNTASGSVSATSTAQAYSRSAYNKISETALSAINIGWLAQDKSSLNVYSQLTSSDNAEYYTFTLQAGDNLKFGFDTKQTKTPSAFRVQIMNSTGTQVLADSEGTAAQQAAYKSLTTTNGLAAKPGNFVVKISYAADAPKTTQNYDFNIFSGTSYAAQYKTIASAQTYGNAALSGSLSGSNSATGMAAYLTTLSNGGSADVLAALQEYV